MRIPRPLRLALRIGVSAALLAYLLSRLDLGQMARFLRNADWGLVALTLLAVAADRFLMAGRWIYLLEALGIRAPRGRVVKIFFLSTFFGSFLPTGVGGEAVRALSFTRLTSRGVEAVASVAMDRALGLLSMLLTGLAALIVFYRTYPHPGLLVTVLVLSLAAAGGLLLSMSPRLHRRLSGWVPSGGLLGRGLEALARYRERSGWLLLVLGMSVGVQVLRVIQAFLLSEAMALDTRLLYFFCFVPLILVVTMLPISVSGIGTTNLVYVALFGTVGMDPDGAFVLSVLILALGILGNLPGGIIYAFEGFSAAESMRLHADGDHAELERARLLESRR